MKKSVLVVFGGRSSEHIVSCMSAINVIKNIDTERYDVTLIGITEEGKWLLVDSVEQIEDESWRKNTTTAILSPDATEKSVIVLKDGKAEMIRIDVVFPVLHGLWGEDGTIQGIFELAKIPVPEIDAIEHMFLELYLALVLMTIDITKLAPVAGQMGIILLAQAILMALFAIFVSFNVFGRDYGAAVMAAGNCGWGCGSGPNAVANEKAVMDQYGWHTVAWVLYPSFAVIIDDIYNPIFLSIFSSLITK